MPSASDLNVGEPLGDEVTVLDAAISAFNDGDGGVQPGSGLMTGIGSVQRGPSSPCNCHCSCWTACGCTPPAHWSCVTENVVIGTVVVSARASGARTSH